MPSTKTLGVYLDDHLAGATAGVELARRIDSDHGDPVLAALVEDIEQDRAALQELMDRLGIQRNPLKQVAGWVSEKVAMLRFSERLTGSPELTRLLRTEALSLGIEGKLALWRALKEVAPTDPRLTAIDLDALIDRARRQRETLEPYRLDAAGKAFPA